MDDIEAILGIKYSPEQSLALREMARRANDSFRVQNLLDTDYFVEWDLSGAGGRFLIPGKGRDIGYGMGQAVHPRYISFKFFKESSNIILSAEMKMKIDEENAQREARGIKKMDKTFETGEELHFAQPYLPNQQEKLLELLPKIILGIEKEWGLDAIPYKPTEDKVKWDQVMSIINRPVNKVDEVKVDIKPNDVTPTPDEDILKEVSGQQI